MPEKDSAPADLRRARLTKAVDLAARQGGVVSRAQLREVGMTRGQIRAQVDGRRWVPVHTQVLATHAGELSADGAAWAALLEAGPESRLDGVSALIASGLTGFTQDVIRVSVPKSSRVRRGTGIDIRRTRRFGDDDVAPSGVPRTRPHVAAVHAFLWARSDKQAVLIATMVVQQGLTTAERLGVAALRIRRDRRRALLHETILDLLEGVRSLGEAEFAKACRERGFPEPTRQVVRKGKDGRYYLDVCWDEWGVVVEIDGIQHTWAREVVGDALRQNSLTLTDALVLRLPLLGLRVAADEFFEQIGEALRGRGCPMVDDQTA